MSNTRPITPHKRALPIEQRFKRAGSLRPIVPIALTAVQPALGVYPGMIEVSGSFFTLSEIIFVICITCSLSAAYFAMSR